LCEPNKDILRLQFLSTQQTVDVDALKMFSVATKATRRQCTQLPTLNSAAVAQTRSKSTSPYGRSHVWKRRPPVLPNPIVPKFPQRVIRSDGTSFTHWTTSPRPSIRLTRDTTNNPVWNTRQWSNDRGVEEEGALTGRLGRFNRRFEELGAEGTSEWMDQMVESSGGTGGTLWKDAPTKVNKQKKGGK
jgi:hypothetical protein